MSPAFDSYVFAVFSALMCVACAAAAWIEYRHTREPLTPWTLVMAMAVFDIYLPSVSFVLVGHPPSQPPWLPARWAQAVPGALLMFTAGLVVFAIGYVTVARPGGRQETEASRPRPTVRIRTSRAWLLLLLSLAAYAWSVSWGLLPGESLGEFALRRLTVRFESQPVAADSLGMALLYRVAPAMVSVFFVMVGVLFAGRRRFPLLHGGIVPALGLLVAGSTLYRGTILMYLVGLALVAAQPGRASGRGRLAGALRGAMTGRRVVVLIVTVAAFLAFGAARSYFTVQAWSTFSTASTSRIGTDAALSAALQFVRGEGLISLASILAYYPERRELFWGKTFIDVLLLPVPRGLWPDKPTWYGIDDITRAMGWPETTQSPVTMPGELYANFGYLGTLLMLGYGIAFGVFYRWRRHPRFRFVYAFLLVPVVTVTSWMAFTGFVNQLIPIPLTWLALLFVVAPGRSRVATEPRSHLHDDRGIVREPGRAAAPRGAGVPLIQTSQRPPTMRGLMTGA